MSDAFQQACNTANCLQCVALDKPVGRIIEPEFDFSVLPLKAAEGSTKVKAAIEKVTFRPGDGVQLDAFTDLVHQNKLKDLPSPLACHGEFPVPVVFQMVFRKISDTEYDVIKYYSFSQKIDLRIIHQVAAGEIFLVDYGKNFRGGAQGFQYLLEKTGHFAILMFHFTSKAKSKSKDKSALEKGFAFIQSEGPKSNMNNMWTEWAEIQVNQEDSPIFGWNTGLVKESLKGYASGNVFVQPTENFFLTLHDLSAWFLEDVLFPLLPDLKNKTIVFLGNAGAGKTPAASALAMAFSEYWLLQGGNEKQLQPSFRLASSFDQLRGEPGIRERPDILDDADMSQQALPKLKAFLDSSLDEAYTVERWTTTKFVKNQVRIICDNRVNGKAEDKLKPGDTTIPFNQFLDLIAPAFPEKAERQDILACLKRAHFVVNLDYATYVRPAGICESPVTIVPYREDECNRPITDFISSEGKKIIGRMKDGDKTPPKDWISKRQWCHDLLSLCLETNQQIPRIHTIIGRPLFGGERYRKEIKPKLPSSGRVCKPPESMLDFFTTTSAMPAPVRIKQEPGTFQGSLKRFHTKIIDLDSPSPAKSRQRVVAVECPEAPAECPEVPVSQDDGFPAVGHCPDGQDQQDD